MEGQENVMTFSLPVELDITGVSRAAEGMAKESGQLVGEEPPGLSDSEQTRVKGRAEAEQSVAYSGNQLTDYGNCKAREFHDGVT